MEFEAGIVKCLSVFLSLELLGCLWSSVVLLKFVNLFFKSVKYDAGIIIGIELNL